MTQTNFLNIYYKLHYWTVFLKIEFHNLSLYKLKCPENVCVIYSDVQVHPKTRRQHFIQSKFTLKGAMKDRGDLYSFNLRSELSLSFIVQRIF